MTQGTQMVEEYMTEFTLYLSKSGYSGTELLRLFKRGLNQEIVCACYQQYPPPEDFYEWVLRAAKVEHAMRDMQSFFGNRRVAMGGPFRTFSQGYPNQGLPPHQWQGQQPHLQQFGQGGQQGQQQQMQQCPQQLPPGVSMDIDAQRGPKN